MSKPLVRLLCLVATMAVIVSACADEGAQTDGGADAEGAAEGQATLRYAYWGPNQTDAMQQIASEFESENPGIKVRLELTPWNQYWTKLQTSTTGGAAPDVFWINAPNFPAYAASGQLLSMEEWLSASGLDLSKYPSEVVNLYQWEGEQYAFPKDFDTIGLWYNKELFEAAGVDFPSEDWTWEDVTETAQQLTDPDQGVFGIAAKLDSQVWHYNLIPQAGGYVINEERTDSGYDSPGAIEALEWTADLINEHNVSPDLGQMSESDPRQMFQSGHLAMMYDGSFAAIELYENPYTRENADVSTLPAGPEGRVSVIHGVGQAISADTEYPEEAQRFVEFLVGERGAAIQGETGTTLPSLEGGQEAWVESMPEFNLQAFLDEVEYTIPYPTSETAIEWQSLEADLLPSVWDGSRPAAEVGEELASQMNELLETEHD